MKADTCIQKWQQELNRVSLLQKQLVVMDDDDEMLSDFLQRERDLIDSFIKDLKNLCPTL